AVGTQSDSWEWDPVGNTWRLLAVTSAAAPARDLHAAAFDLLRLRLVVVGGYSTGPTTYYGDVWEGLAAPPSAAAPAYGQGCAGTAGIPALGALGVPKLGNASFGLRLTNARASAGAAVLLGDLPARAALPGGCTLLVAGTFVSIPLFTDAGGAATLPLAVP